MEVDSHFPPLALKKEGFSEWAHIFRLFRVGVTSAKPLLLDQARVNFIKIGNSEIYRIAIDFALNINLRFHLYILGVARMFCRICRFSLGSVHRRT